MKRWGLEVLRLHIPHHILCIYESKHLAAAAGQKTMEENLVGAILYMVAGAINRGAGTRPVSGVSLAASAAALPKSRGQLLRGRYNYYSVSARAKWLFHCSSSRGATLARLSFFPELFPRFRTRAREYRG